MAAPYLTQTIVRIRNTVTRNGVTNIVSEVGDVKISSASFVASCFCGMQRNVYMAVLLSVGSWRGSWFWGKMGVAEIPVPRRHVPPAFWGGGGGGLKTRTRVPRLPIEFSETKVSHCEMETLKSFSGVQCEAKILFWLQLNVQRSENWNLPLIPSSFVGNPPFCSIDNVPVGGVYFFQEGAFIRWFLTNPHTFNVSCPKKTPKTWLGSWLTQDFICNLLAGARSSSFWYPILFWATILQHTIRR